MRAVSLGMKVTDVVTGFKGIVTGQCKYISGCNQSLVQPQVKPDGGFEEGRWFDDQRLYVDYAFSPVVLDNGATPGADKPAPVR